jgi:hypothetical protein
MEECKEFFQQQVTQMKIVSDRLLLMEAKGSVSALAASLPFPKPLQLEGDMNCNFSIFRENFESYCVATQLDKMEGEDAEKQKVNVLLSLIGDQAKKNYNNFDLSMEIKETCNATLDAIKKKVSAGKNVMYERFLFHNCNQLMNESFDDYQVRVSKCIDLCEYEKIPIAEIREKITLGFSSS